MEFTVDRVVLHKDHTNVYGGNDIALLYVNETITYTDIIKPACLPTSADEYNTRSRCFLVGWGKIGTGPGEYPETLQEAKYKLRPSTPCNVSWNGVIQDSMVCAGQCSFHYIVGGMVVVL